MNQLMLDETFSLQECFSKHLKVSYSLAYSSNFTYSNLSMFPYNGAISWACECRAGILWVGNSKIRKRGRKLNFLWKQGSIYKMLVGFYIFC